MLDQYFEPFDNKIKTPIGRFAPIPITTNCNSTTYQQASTRAKKMIITPDELLESSSCNVCYKFLSVGPVKVYPNGKTKCGRCSGKKDLGTVLKIGCFEGGLFKCINRFDGCKLLLTTDQVRVHESTCRSSEIPCPSCPRHPVIPLYRMIQHFKERHRDSWLTIPSFRVNLENLRIRNYLYRLQDQLFFVEFTPRYEGSFLLNVCCVSKGLENIKQKFIVYFGDHPVPYESILATCSLKDKFPGFTIETPDDYEPKFAYIEFQLEFGDVKLIPKGDTPIAAKETLGIPRKVRLAKHTDPLLSVGQDGTSIILNRPGSTSKSEIFMYCFVCEYTEAQDHLKLAKVKPDTYHVVCRHCECYVKMYLGLEILPASLLYPGLRGVEFEYSCVWSSWGCSKYHPHVTLEDHELDCPKQPLQKCPVLACGFQGRLEEIDEHFEYTHPQDVVVLKRCATEIDDLRALEGVYMYVWVFCGFVPIEVAPDDGVNGYAIALLEEDVKDEGPNQPKPEIMVSIPKSGKVFSIGDDQELYLKNGVTAYVTCFFRANDLQYKTTDT